MSSSVYFVTGAAGFVGQHVCAHLRARGQIVRGLVRRTEDGGLTQLGVEVVQGDLADPAPWRERLQGVHYVIHCAANASFRGKSSDYESANVEGTRRLLGAMAEAAPGLQRLVFVSTIGAVDRAAADNAAQPLDEDSPPRPKSAYGRSKLRAERLVRACGLPFAIVRPTMVVGADMRPGSHFAVFARMALRGSPGARVAWPGALSVVHVDDLAAALELCATHPQAAGRTFFCAGEPLAVAACFALAAPGARRVPFGWAARLAAVAPRLLPFAAKALLRPALVASDVRLRALGWQPTFTAAAALQTVIAREHARTDPTRDPGGQTVITGAASGLGRALVERLALLREHLLLVDRDAAGLEEVRRRIPKCRVQVVDLSDEAAVTAFTRSEAWRAQPVRELYACAGFGARGPVADVPVETQARLFKVNVLARLTLAHAALPGMVRAGLGRIVFISSSSAFQPLPYMAAYAASNAALLMLGEAWNAEIAGAGVHLMSVCPGGMSTNFQHAAGVRISDDERLMSPASVADAILRGLARTQPTLIVSPRAHAMAWLARGLPRRASVALWKRLMSKLR